MLAMMGLILIGATWQMRRLLPTLHFRLSKTLAPIIEDWVFDCDEDETVVLESLKRSKPMQADQPRKGKMATGRKESSNPGFWADSCQKTISPMIHLSQKVYHFESGVEDKSSKDCEDKLQCMIYDAEEKRSIFEEEYKKLCLVLILLEEHLVQERFKDHPLEGHDLDLWGDLRMIFDPNEEDDIWLKPTINMLVEKKYPLKKEILEKMINLKIEAEEESTMAHELIKFIKSQIAEQNLKVNHKFRGGLLGIKELLQDNAAEGLNTASSNS
ncbi:hypothetical protein Tco_0439343 [Tanacetum coccineum]